MLATLPASLGRTLPPSKTSPLATGCWCMVVWLKTRPASAMASARDPDELEPLVTNWMKISASHSIALPSGLVVRRTARYCPASSWPCSSSSGLQIRWVPFMGRAWKAPFFYAWNTASIATLALSLVQTLLIMVVSLVSAQSSRSSGSTPRIWVL